MTFNLNKLALFIAVFFLMSCKKDAIETIVPESTIVDLEYPRGYGHSGDSHTSVVGFGYDATGICDTISVKAKVLNLNLGHLVNSRLFTAGSGNSIGATSYADLLGTIFHDPKSVDEPDELFVSHFKNLLKIGLKSDSIDFNCGYAYYSYLLLDQHVHYHLFPSDIESTLTTGFKSDLIVLSSEEMVDKYGTHVLTSAYTGAKFEVIYKCDLEQGDSDHVFKLLHERVNQFFSGVPGLPIYEREGNYSANSEQLIFNTIGGNRKLFGLINATDNNADSIYVDLSSIFNDETNYQFVKVGKEGLVPLYDLVSDPDRKQALTEYITEIVRLF